MLTGFLLAFYRSLGLAAAYALDSIPEGGRLGERTAFCFAGKESFDILVNGNKIGGNAQRRLKRVIFQHGSIPLLNRADTGLMYMRERAPELAGETVSLAECGVTTDREALLNQLATAFGTYFRCTFTEAALSGAEQADMQQLLSSRYSGDLWNLEGTDA